MELDQDTSILVLSKDGEGKDKSCIPTEKVRWKSQANAYLCYMHKLPINSLKKYTIG